jgi:hypothetical protein
MLLDTEPVRTKMRIKRFARMLASDICADRAVSNEKLENGNKSSNYEHILMIFGTFEGIK